MSYKKYMLIGLIVSWLIGVSYLWVEMSKQDYQIQKSPNYINSDKMKKELAAWFYIAQNSRLLLCDGWNLDCDAYLIANDFTTLTNQQIEIISENKTFNFICKVGFDDNQFYKQFPNYVGASESATFDKSVDIILNGPSKLGSRKIVIEQFKKQFTKNCNLIYCSNNKYKCLMK